MFENCIGQEGALQLAQDIHSDSLAPSILLAGPPASGKGTCALELARVLSCGEKNAPWNCSCSACAQHRDLTHPDLLLMGGANFSSEINAAAQAFMRDPESSARFLFIRSLRKLLGRFNSILWEGEEGRLNKLIPLISGISESIEDFEQLIKLPASEQENKRKKICEALVRQALKLESDGIGLSIPIAQVRRASYWAHLAPNGKRKCIIIEQADTMQESARNALLKLLEEPPANTLLILCSARRTAMLPTILSRLRTYLFFQRDEKSERDVIRRIFKDPEGSEKLSRGRGYPSLVSAYLDGFLPIDPDTLDGIAAFYAASAASFAVVKLRRNSPDVPLPQALVALGKAAAQGAEARGFGRPIPDPRTVSSEVLRLAEGFELRSLFNRFLSNLMHYCGLGLDKKELGPEAVLLAESWTQAIKTAELAVATYNQSPLLTMERLFLDLSEGGAGIAREYLS